MILTYVTYALLFVLLCWGGKFAHGENKFHEDSFSLEVTKCLRGFAAIGVILHHISQEEVFQNAGGQNHPGELSIFVNAGFFFVAIFFFCSGYGLIKSLNSKTNYFEGFIKKRIVKTIVIPFYVNVILFAIFNVICKVQMPVAHWITNFLGLTLMNEYAWYPIVLTLLYFAFYFIFKNIKNRKICFLIMFIVIFLQGVFFCITGHFAWWAGPKNWWISDQVFEGFRWWMDYKIIWFFGEWWVNSSIAFLIGMIIAQNEEKIKNWFQKKYVIKLIVLVLITIGFHYLSGFTQSKFGYWSEFDGNGPGILNKFMCYLAQLPEVTSFVLLVYVIMYVYHVKNPILKFFGNVSYETYMMNYIAIIIFRFFLYKFDNNQWQYLYKAHNYNLVLYEVCVIASTILLGLLFKWLNKMINKLIK